MKKIKTVIIGMGRMGNTRLKALIEHGGYEIVGLCDADISKQKGYSVPFFSNWKQCIDDCAPESVFVCTINGIIPDVVCYALEKGINVFAEKPPGKNLDDALRMQEVSKEYPHLVLKFGFNHRYHNSVIEAKALIDSGLIGEVVCARGVYGKTGSLNFANEWRNDVVTSGGGILLDQGIHMLDLLRYFVGDFSQVMSSVDNLVWKELETEDSAFAILKTKEGKVASLHSNALQWNHKFDLDIMCTNGYVALNGLLTSTKSYGEERMTYYRKDLTARSGALGKPIEHTLAFDSDSSWDYEIAEFYEAVVCGEPVRNGTGNDAIEVMRLIERIYKGY